jgi:hypothetical protein
MKATNEDEEEGSMAKKSECLESSCGRGGRGVQRGGGVGRVRSLPPPPRSHSHNSSTSQLEYDSNNSMNETRQTLDINSLHKSHSHDPLDNNKAVSSNESSLQGSDKESILSSSDGVSTHNPNKAEDIGCSGFVDNEVISPVECATDLMFCRLECGFPDMIQDVNESLSNDLQNLIFQVDVDGEEEAGAGEEEAGELFLLSWSLQ